MLTRYILPYATWPAPVRSQSCAAPASVSVDYLVYSKLRILAVLSLFRSSYILGCPDRFAVSKHFSTKSEVSTNSGDLSDLGDLSDRSFCSVSRDGGSMHLVFRPPPGLEPPLPPELHDITRMYGLPHGAPEAQADLG